MLTPIDKTDHLLRSMPLMHDTLDPVAKANVDAEITEMLVDGCILCKHMARLATIGLCYSRRNKITAPDLVLEAFDEGDVDNHANIYYKQHELACDASMINPKKVSTVYQLVFWLICVGQVLVARQKMVATCN